MTRPIPYTAAALARAIKGVTLAGHFAVGIKVSDGTLIIADKPVDVTSIAPSSEPASPPPPRRRIGERTHNG